MTKFLPLMISFFPQSKSMRWKQSLFFSDK